MNGELVSQGVYSAFKAEGYVTEDGVRDQPKLRARLFEIVAGAKVVHKSERGEKAVTRGELMSRAFPSLPGPEDWAEQDDPALAAVVYQTIDRTYVWPETSGNAATALQRMAGVNMGNGYVVLRTKIGRDAIPAVYISDNAACIDADGVLPVLARRRRAAETAADYCEMITMRHPELGRHMENVYSRTLRSAVDAGTQRLRLATESVAPQEESEDEDERDAA